MTKFLIIQKLTRKKLCSGMTNKEKLARLNDNCAIIITFRDI